MAELRRNGSRRRSQEGRRGSETNRSDASCNGKIYGVTPRGRRSASSKKRRGGAAVVLGILLILLAAVGGLVYVKYGPGRTWAELGDVYGAGADGTVVVCGGDIAESRILSRDGVDYIPVSVAAMADGRWYLGDDGLLLYSVADETITFASEKTEYMTEGSTHTWEHVIFLNEEGEGWISAAFLKDFSGFDFTLYEADKERDVPARIYVDNGWEERHMAKLRLPSAVRRRAGMKSPILTRAKMGASVKVLDTIDNWTKIRTEDGYEGYVLSAFLGSRKTEGTEGTRPFSEYASVSLPETVCMVFHQTFSAGDNEKLSSLLENADGVNVIAPTWFSVKDEQGNLASLADKDYVDLAHEKGIQVWGLVDDFHLEIGSSALLSSTAARANVIRQLMEAVDAYELDGINVDFEGVKKDNASHFLQFIRELSIALRARKKVLSIDNYVPSSGRRWYDLEQQGLVADYVVIMGYDEHYKGSEPGTNASLSFTVNGLAQTLYSVPGDKVIYALPFFTRLWWSGPEGDSSRAVGIRESIKLVEENAAEVAWIDELGQYYVTWEQEGNTYEIWLEETESLSLKLKEIQQAEVAGAAFWKLGLETEEVWEAVREGLPEE